MTRKYFVLAFILALSFNAFPQSEPQSKVTDENTLQIKGVVRPLGSRSLLRDALIIDLSDKTHFVRTDKNGSFLFSLPKNSKGILIRAENYEDLEVKLDGGKLSQESPFSLEPSAIYGGYGIIRANSKEEISQNSFQQEEISHVAGTGNDAVRTLQTLPSVLPSNIGSANIVVRGGLPGDNSFFYDDLLLPFIFHFGGAETIIPTRIIESMDFYPGAFSSRYSDTIGGIIQLRSPGNIPSRTSGEFELGLIQSGIYLEGNSFSDKNENKDAENESENKSNKDKEVQNKEIEKGESGIGYRVGYRRTYLEIYKPLINKLSKNSSFFTIPQATDYQIILNGNHSKGSWQAYLLAAEDSASLSAPIGKSTTASGQNSFSFYNYMETTGARYSLNLGDGYGMRFLLQQRYFIYQQNIFGNTIDIRSHLFTLGIILDKKITEEISFSVGLRPKYAYNEVGIDVVQYPSGNPTIYFDPELAPRVKDTVYMHQFYGDLFLDVIYSPVKNIKINPGINMLKGPGQNQFTADPRLGLRYEFLEGQTFKIAWGYYSQIPDPQYTAPGYGNPNLQLEKSIQYVAGIESKFFEDYFSDLQFWYKTSDNLVGAAVNNPSNKYENSIKSRAQGIEFFIKKKPSDFWYGWFSYGLSVAELRDPASGIWRYSSYDRRHSINLVYGQKITNRWNAGTRIQFITGAPYNTVSNGTYDQNTGAYAPAPDGNTYLINKNDARNPYFFEVDFRTEYDFLFKDWTLTSYLDILNLFNRSNVAFTTYNRDYSNRVEVSSLPIIPSIGIIAKF